MIHLQQTIGDYVVIEDASIIEAASIGSCVQIGKNCIIGKGCIIKESCRIEDNSVLVAETVVPPFSVFSGFPAQRVSELPECFPLIQKDIAISLYKSFTNPNQSSNSNLNQSLNSNSNSNSIQRPTLAAPNQTF
eukprot:TRINITY_DN6148_c0_g1_i7.p1 TRINITY_DN6148_c0_g1~~TRINITY_DN6148_c0_g1_i7.p1  ORF type:complete len:134 (-),score=63.20 TRINITY_DN6148_c0_g1_i7:46-447(-)